MRKLKFNFSKTKNYIITALATTMLTTFVSGCTPGGDIKKFDPNTYDQPQIEQTVNINQDGTIEIIEKDEKEEVVKEEKAEISADKIVITSEEDIQEALKYDSIRYLKIDKANIKDFSFLKNINIELLQVLYNEEPLDMKEINSSSIKQIYLHNVELKNEQEISSFSNLENFVLKHNDNRKDVTNLDFLSECKKLTNIEIENYGITNLSFAKEMKDLKNLSVINSSLEDISGISNCKQLTDITLSEGKIQDIGVLKNLNKLKSIDLSDNYIDDISGINSKELVYLNLKNNFIKDVSSFNPSNLLIGINLSQNYITDFPTHFIKDGISLDVSYNNISTLSNEDKSLLQNTNVFVNLFDNQLDSRILNEVAYYPTIYFETEQGALTPEQAIEYNKKIKEILSTMNKGEDKANAIKVNKYIIHNCRMDYTYNAENKDNAYGALFDQSVCTGMTDLTNSLFRHLDIKVKSYHGDFKDQTDNARHVWSIYQVGNEWYHCDAMQSKLYKDEKGYPKIVMVSDSQIQEYGHILDAINVQKCNSEVSKEERNDLISKIEISRQQDLDER